MKGILIGLLVIVSSTWYLDIVSTIFPPDSAPLWIIRQDGLYLSGLLSITLMSLSMLLATRPAWLEKPLGGMDRIYRLHKWSGILAISFGVIHWLIKQSDDLIEALVGTEDHLPATEHRGLLKVLRELGDEMGEPALYLILIMLAITLWRRFPYHLWRHLHRIMPVLYLMLAFHAAVLAPSHYWTQPVGALLAIFITVGGVASVISLAGLIGRSRQVSGLVVAIKSEGDVTEITCELDEKWQGHRPGQFAFLTFDRLEGAHPFTIASADRGHRTITFFVKALGNFTQNIAQQARVGKSVTIEGPYGRFLLDRHNPSHRQIWVAGGIGVTPFLAWLESLQACPVEVRSVDLHYCTLNRETDPFVGRLQTLCDALTGIRLNIHSARHGEMLSARSLNLADDPRKKAEVWYCGPNGLAKVLKDALQKTWNGSLRFHQELFEMR